MQTALIVGNGSNRIDPERLNDFLLDVHVVQCNRIFDGFPRDICIRNLNTGLDVETGLTWYKALTFQEIIISFASITCFRDRKELFADIKKFVSSAQSIGATECIVVPTQDRTHEHMIQALEGALPTTGIMAIQEFIFRGYAKVYITGFDFFGGIEKKGSHRPLLEKAYIQTLIDAGVVEVV